MSDVIAVVPVKSLSDAKSRLAGVLSLDERAGLTLAMLQDVIEALVQSSSVSELLVVSRDESIKRLVSRMGIDVFAESRSGLNEALEEVCDHLLGKCPGQSTMIVPADVPLLTSHAVDEMVAVLVDHEPPVVAATKSKDGGTNALVRRPPDVIPVAFGPGSFEIHRQSTLKMGADFVDYRSDGLALDIDTVEDLEALVRSGSASRAARLAGHLLKSKRRSAVG